MQSVLGVCPSVPGVSVAVGRRGSVTGLNAVDDCNTLLPPEVVRSSNQKEGTRIEPPAFPPARRWRRPPTDADAYVQPRTMPGGLKAFS
jgi:hypothetical protein